MAFLGTSTGFWELPEAFLGVSWDLLGAVLGPSTGVPVALRGLPGPSWAESPVREYFLSSSIGINFSLDPGEKH